MTLADTLLHKVRAHPSDRAVWALSLVNEMARLGVIKNTVSERARYFDAAFSALHPTPPPGDSPCKV